VGIKPAAWLSIGVFAIAACTSGGASSAGITAGPSPSFGTYVSSGIGCDRPAPTPAAGPVATRLPIPDYGGYGGLAVDGNGIAWFGGAGYNTLFCYGAVHKFGEFRIAPKTQFSMFRTAPDGSVWYADPVRGVLGRIGRNGVLTERQVAGSQYHPWALAIGPDGSVWFDIDSPPANGIARLRPDGRLTTYPVPNGSSITVDSHGNAWIATSDGREIVRISDTGEIFPVQVAVFNIQLAQAADGHMWFPSIGCASVQQIGWIDANGQTRLFDAAILDNSASPNAAVRAPDGAVWFGTIDGRLIRIASGTDVTIYSLPWPDARIGPFVVLPHNHILMIGFRELVNWVATQELLDFTAVNGTRLAGIQAIPGPLPHFTKDAADAAAYQVAAQASIPNANIVLQQSWEGSHAALFQYVVNQSRCGGQELQVDVVEDPAGWRKYYAFQNGSFPVPAPGAVIPLKFLTGCLNVHESPSLGSQTLHCLPSNSTVQVDKMLPVYADGYIWWHIESHDGQFTPLGWAVQDYLLCTDNNIGRLAQCN
jgi:streptogramin lyase